MMAEMHECNPLVTCKCSGNETFLCCKSDWRPSYHQSTAALEKILPWWVSEHRNVGKIPQIEPNLIILGLMRWNDDYNQWCFCFRNLFSIFSLDSIWTWISLDLIFSAIYFLWTFPGCFLSILSLPFHWSFADFRFSIVDPSRGV